jgi:hypothetical protein
MEAISTTPLLHATAPPERLFWTRVIAVSPDPHTPLAAVLRSPWRWLNGADHKPIPSGLTASILSFPSLGRTPTDTSHTKDDDKNEHR